MADLKLKDPDLLKQKAYINGKWIDAKSGQTIEVENPATGEVFATVPALSKEEVEQCVADAEAALAEWRDKTANERGAILRKWFELIMENEEDLAKIITAEQGKPLKEARTEIAYGASYIEWFAEEGKRIYGDTIPGPAADKRILALKQPIGVCAAITPWNFPNAMITRKAAPALAAGCSFIIRPASKTPLSAFSLAELAHRAGIPAGVVNVVTGHSSEIGKVLTQDKRIKKFTFTGSTEVGKKLLEQTASTIKKVSLELGGNAPFIVFNDADIDEAVKGAIACKFRNMGQACVCANRFYVQSGIYDEFVEKFKAATEALTIGKGTEEGVDGGPLIDKEAVENVQGYIKDAQSHGGEVVTGGEQLPEFGPLFYRPTIIKNATQEMRFAKEEIFGPLAPVFKFETEEEVIEWANDTDYGLACYFYTRDVGTFVRLSEKLEYGIVGANSGLLSNTAAPFGGVKESGLGREGSKYGIEDYLEIKYVLLTI